MLTIKLTLSYQKKQKRFQENQLQRQVLECFHRQINLMVWLPVSKMFVRNSF